MRRIVFKALSELLSELKNCRQNCRPSSSLSFRKIDTGQKGLRCDAMQSIPAQCPSTCWSAVLSAPFLRSRPAHILGGWMRYTLRFLRKPWEIVKIHEISLNFHENPSKSMKNHGFSGFPKDPWEIWVYISSTPLSCVHA